MPPAAYCNKYDWIKKGDGKMGKVLLMEPTIEAEGVAYLKEHCEVYTAPDGKRETMIRWINRYGIEAMIVRSEVVDRAVIEACPTLRIVGEHGVGTDNIDLAAAREHGVKVLNTPLANAVSVAEHSIMLMLALSRRLCRADRMVRAGQWARRDNMPTFDLCGKTLYVVGFGRTGRKTAELARAFGMRVLAYDLADKAAQMQSEEVEAMTSLRCGLPQADYVSVHLPLTETTTGLISRGEFAAMKRTACFISMSRGQVVDEAALAEALANGTIAGAGLDVLQQEPPQPDNPLLRMEQVILTPHIGGCTSESRQRMAEKVTHTVVQALAGEETDNWVNP